MRLGRQSRVVSVNVGQCLSVRETHALHTQVQSGSSTQGERPSEQLPEGSGGDSRSGRGQWGG